MAEEMDAPQEDGDDYYTFLNIPRNVRGVEGSVRPGLGDVTRLPGLCHQITLFHFTPESRPARAPP